MGQSRPHESSPLEELNRRETPPSLRELPKATPAPAAQTPVAANEATAPRSPRQRRLRIASFLLLPLALIGGLLWYVYGGSTMATDDAYVDAEKVAISTDVSGIVSNVYVRDNQEVAADQVLYRLDPLQFRIALASARGDRAETALTLRAMQKEYGRLLTEAGAQAAQVALDHTQYARAVRLLAVGVESRARYDRARYRLQADESRLTALRQQAGVQLARLDGNPDLPIETLPQYLRAQARVAEARRELNHSVVRAPFAGRVTDVPAIAPGKYLAASSTAFYLVDTHHVWIEAKPKETQLTYVRPGQRATVTVDAYPDVQWHGTVESISPAAAQEFSLLPAEDSSGNWVKVVQRVQLRIRLDEDIRRMPPLSAGMSAQVYVDTGHSRGWPHIISDLL